MSNRLVKDYLGNLIPKSKARKIHEKYYVEGESCFLMEDNQWYRITSTDKITFDYYTNKWVLIGSVKLTTGIVDENGKEGSFSDNIFTITASNNKSKDQFYILNEQIAIKLGYVESIYDGIFYLSSSLTEKDIKEWFNKKNIPNHERSKSYNLESDPERKKELEESYNKLDIPISAVSKRLSKFIGDYTFGAEFEVINGFLPKRIRNKLGIKALKDGSLRSDSSEGIEMVTMPMSGAKGIEVLKQVCGELKKRCEVNNYCSVHFHFGNVRKDKLYALSVYKVGSMLQTEMIKYFPYSRFNSIKADGKVYCQMLQNLGINYSEIMNKVTEEDFHKSVIFEFNKIYKFLNNGKGLAETHGEPELIRTTTTIEGKKMFYDKWLKNIYSTKTIYHSNSGQKWDKPARYYWINFLNLYFSKIGTIEFRAEPGSTSFTKTMIWMLTCASILRYSEDVKRCFTTKSLTLKEVLLENLGEKYTEYIMEYYNMRYKYFFDSSGGYRDYKKVEKVWFAEDPDFNFEVGNFSIK
jgi:hypothetical protein